MRSIGSVGEYLLVGNQRVPCREAGTFIGTILLLSEKDQDSHEAQTDRIGLTHSATAFAIMQLKDKEYTVTIHTLA